MPTTSMAKHSAVLIPPPLQRTFERNENDTKKSNVEEFTRKISNIEDIAIPSANMKTSKGRARKVSINLEKPTAAVNSNKSRSSSNKKSSSVLPAAATNSVSAAESNPASSKAVGQNTTPTTHVISMMSAVELAKASHPPVSILSPKRAERQSSSLKSNAKSPATNLSAPVGNEQHHCDVENDENLFQIVPSSRPRFLKRKYSDLNKQIKCTSVEADGSSARIVGSGSAAIRKETIVDIISSDEEFPC